MDIDRILELAGIVLREDISIKDARHYLETEYWQPVSQNQETEVWEHMDDPSTGAYVIHLATDGNVDSIEYSSPLSPIFKQHFTTLGSFIHHVSTITNDEINFRKGIDNLRHKFGDDLEEHAPTIKSASTGKDGGINRRTANRMVDPKGYFQKNKNKNFHGKGSFYEGKSVRDYLGEIEEAPGLVSRSL